MGMFLAWCVNMNLVSERLLQRAEPLVLRVRYREITGSELLVAGCGGRLESRDFSPAGNAFCERYYAQYLDDYRQAFGADIYNVRDDWEQYDRLAPTLTAHLLGRPRRRWWRFWR